MAKLLPTDVTATLVRPDGTRDVLAFRIEYAAAPHPGAQVTAGTADGPVRVDPDLVPRGN